MIYLGILLIAVALHPFVTYPLSLMVWRLLRPRSLANTTSSALPPISLLCCAHNEESVIAAKVENSLAAAKAYDGKVEILFFLDGCTDRTAEILAGYSNRISVIDSPGRHGKSTGMARLVAASTGEIIAFTDANTMIAADALSAFSDHFVDPRIGCVCSYLRVVNSFEGQTAQVNSRYWRFEEWLKLLETETGTTLSADGGLFAIRRSLYSPTPPDIIDDMHTSMNVLLSGARVISSRTVLAEERTTPVQRDEFRRKVRIACRAFNCFRVLAPRLNSASLEIVYKFYSHKLLRWIALPIGALGGVLIVVGLVAAGLGLIAGVLFIASLAALGLGRLKLPVFATLYEIVFAHWAVTLGVVDSLSGKRYQTWAPAISGR